MVFIFAVIPFDLHYYIFDFHNHDSAGQTAPNGSSDLIKFQTIENVLSFSWELGILSGKIDKGSNSYLTETKS